jgi:hypothetical protein
MLLQAASATAPIVFDLARVAPPRQVCGQGNGGEIVVCASNSTKERIVVLPPATEPMLPRAEIGLFGKVRGGLVTEQKVVGGFPSNAVKATIKVPF